MNAVSCPIGLSRTPGQPRLGQLVVARAWKYDGTPHWVVPGYLLGSDEYGYWIFQSEGSLVSRPGRAHLAACDALCLIPHTGSWVGTFYDNPGEDVDVYLDISTRIGWQTLPTGGWEVNSIDMDLDVIRSNSRGLFLDDEDEFEEHAHTMGYPGPLIEQMRNSAAELMTAVRADQPPFNRQYRATWLERATELRAPNPNLSETKDH